jgi:hypothetical protein
MRFAARRLRRLTCAAAALAVTAAMLATTAPAGAEPAAGIVGTTLLVTFDTDSPSVLTVRPISGLASAMETVVGIDMRPATGQLYAVTVPLGIVANALVRTYVVDPATGAATLVGSIPNTVAGAADTQWGVDVNPTVDRVRAVLANNENFRINPNNGSLAGDDVNLTFSGGATGPIIAAAYDRNTARDPSTGPTTLYEIDRGASTLDVQGGIDGRGPGGANGGQVTAIGPLGVTLDAGSDAGLDVSGASGVAYASLRSGRVSGLYTIDLATGAATLVGSFPLDVRDVAILPQPAVPPPPPPPPPPPSPSPPPAPPADTVAPTGLLDFADSATFGRLLRTKLPLGFSCNEACAATATLRARRTTLATGTGSLTSASAGTLKLTPTRSGRRYLSRRRHPRRRRVRATLSVTLADTAGNHAALSRGISLRRR